jgi:hypothetical protein
MDSNQVWGCRAVIPALRGLREEDQEIKPPGHGSSSLQF